MKKQTLFLLSIVLILPILFGWTIIKDKWIVEKQKGYSLHYKTSDKKNIVKYKAYFEVGKKIVEEFFQNSFKNDFSIYIHPSRSSLDSTWQKDWKMPEFKSECWMVASGVATKLDILSPKLWDKLSCEHIYSETTKTQQLITHELVHVYHGQLNFSPDFSDVEGIDWFVEGLATFASGQCDSLRISEVKRAISENKIPKNLDNFWTGKNKYGLSGSLVMYIDHKYGRKKLIELLPLIKKTDILLTIGTTEVELLNEWKKYIQEL
jgi:hypothetical protein